MKTLLSVICLSFLFPAVMKAQYSGGNGRGDAMAESLNLPVSVAEPGQETGKTIHILQNTPNPFNEKTTIRYEIADRVNAVITICDRMGRTIRSVQCDGSTAGIHTMEFDGSALSAGIYLCRISAWNHSETIRMILSR